MRTVLMMISNVFMTFAWYGHLKHLKAPLVFVGFAFWGRA